MKATLRLEEYGDNMYAMMRFYTRIIDDGCPGLGTALGTPRSNNWIAMITGHDSRVYLKPKKDYKKANSVGSRGVYLFYLLETGYVYEVSSQISWQRIRRYFCTVSDSGDIIEITRAEVEQWASDHSILMY